MTRCTHCGAENSSSSVFCHSCNEFLDWDKGSTAVEPVARTIAVIDETVKIAAQEGRDDLEQHLQAAKERLTEVPVPVVVAGEFKRGKSTLINALLQRSVCPVDADLVTAVPTTVRWAEQPQLTAYRRSADGDLVARPAPLEELELLVTERADPGNPELERFVEVGLPHRMLRTGLRLVDSPGVGGLDSAHGFLTLGTLTRASGVLFVTDAAQELTQPELEFLTTAVERCPRTALVITKTDLYRGWRRIAELDHGHLERAGLQLPVITVSSFLRLRATSDPGLDQESGFVELVRFVAQEVVAACRMDSARDAAAEVDVAVDHLTAQAEAELVVLSDPERADRTVDRLDEASHRAGRLVSPSATWQQLLADSITDLASDIEHDLTRRLRTVLSGAEELINNGDPQRTWTETEAWLRRQAAIAAVANRDLLTERARAVTQQIAETFDLQAEDIDLGLADAQTGLDAITFATAESLKMPGGKVLPLVTSVRSSMYLPMAAGGLAVGFDAGSVVHLAVVGVAAALGAGIGRKIISDERNRQLTYRRQQAQAAVRKFVDEVAFVLNKQTRDSLRATQRRLRDDFAERALLVQRSAAAALERAHRARTLEPEQRQLRSRQITDQQHRINDLHRSVRELVTDDA